MTREEAERLRPGDKVVYTGIFNHVIIDFQKKNGGFLTYKELRCPYGIYKITIEETSIFIPVIENIKLYKLRPWSYERDY
jgi:hypothetical protein